MAEEVRAHWSGKRVVLTRRAVLDAAAGLPLDVGIRQYAVTIEGHAYPPKAIVAKAAGLSTRDFNAAQARRLLSRLGFESRRVHASTGSHGRERKGRRRLTAKAMALSRSIAQQLEGLGTDLGFQVEKEVPVAVGRLDQVWFHPFTRSVEGLPARIPVIAFELESSWRTRKHVKGDLMNLAASGASLGILVICGTSRDDDQLRNAASRFVDALGSGQRVVVWSERDVEAACR